MKHLPIKLSDWEFVSREKTSNGKTVPFRCGRDFIYYALHYYQPQLFNRATGGPQAIEKMCFGHTLPTFLLFSAFHLKQLPKLLTRNGLLLRINGQPVRTWWQLIRQLYRKSVVSRSELDQAVASSISRGTVLGIDISIIWLGLVDHVLFVYGYDDDNYYVFDTLQLPYLPYTRLAEAPETFYMKLPKQAVYDRLRPISRVWTVEPQ